MASISTDKKGLRRILFKDGSGQRRQIHLGKMPIKMARTIKSHIEALLTAALARHSPEPETAEWLGDIEDTLHAKLAAVGLVLPREAAALTTVADFLTEYVKRRVDVKQATKEVWRQIENNLVECFGAKRDIKTIDEPAAEDFKLFLQKMKLSSTTIAKRLQFARQFFKAAVKRKLIASNPFADVAGKAIPKNDRQRFITQEETARLLAACPNVDWRAIVGLSRFGGLRCPSEVLSLQWQWIDWEHGRMRVYSPKTEHHEGKAHRDVPLFPELLAILNEAWDLAPKGAVYVVGNDDYRKAADTATGWRNCNLRTQFARILKKAGLETWPRLFHAMRASRETELVQKHPVHVVTAWLGNTPKIAMKHYLMTTEADFQRAVTSDEIGGAKSGANWSTFVAQNAAQPISADMRQDAPRNAQSLVNQGFMSSVGRCRRLSTKIISGEDRIRTCGAVSHPPI